MQACPHPPDGVGHSAPQAGFGGQRNKVKLTGAEAGDPRCHPELPVPAVVLMQGPPCFHEFFTGQYRFKLLEQMGTNTCHLTLHIIFS